MILDFPAIEAMQEASEAAGWQCEYRQLDAGRLEARTVLRDCDEMSFLRESANRRLSIIAESPAETITVIIPASTSRFRINGIDVVGNTIVVVPASTDFHALSDPGADALSLHIPFDRFRDVLAASSGDPSIQISSAVQSFKAESSTIQELRRSPGDPSSSESLIVELLSHLRASACLDLTSRQARARRVIERAIEYIDANLNMNIRITDLCKVADVSLSTLERVFRLELQMTPHAYIKARRLDAVRRSLINGDPDTPISQLAHDHGISHLGRFAADYRQQFGLLPSEQRSH
ncbi:MAG: helix-turn-helix domain-containing protein [Woeseiaceae bacterium]